MPAFNWSLIDEVGMPADQLAAAAAVAGKWLNTYVATLYAEVGGSTVAVLAKGAPLPAGNAQVVIAPNTTVANSLGYHTKTPDGMPIAIIEMDACIQYNVAPTIVLCHELAEASINPELDQFVASGDRQYPKEIVDPVTLDSFLLDGLPVANVVGPAFWDLTASAGSRFDLLGNVHAPLPTIPRGGWMEWAENGQYQSAWGEDIDPQMAAYMRARMGRRWRLRGSVALTA